MPVVLAASVLVLHKLVANANACDFPSIGSVTGGIGSVLRVCIELVSGLQLAGAAALFLCV
jgi:hypothetical protein